MQAVEESVAPKVFVCHAGKDKDRFVRQFCVHLRKLGVEAIFDEWSFEVGKPILNLLQDGVRESGSFAFVISKHDRSEWVEAEASMGFHKVAIEGGRFFPVVLNDIPSDEIPEFVKAHVYQSVLVEEDGSIIESEIIKAAEACRRQSLGESNPQPEVSRQGADRISDSSSMDLFKLLGDHALEQESDHIRPDVLTDLIEAELSQSSFTALQNIEALKAMGLVEPRWVSGGEGLGKMSDMKFTLGGLEAYFRLHTDHTSIASLQAVYRAFVSHGSQGQRRAVADEANVPYLLIKYLLDVMNLKGVGSNPRGLGDDHYHITSMGFVEKLSQNPSLMRLSAL